MKVHLILKINVYKGGRHALVSERAMLKLSVAASAIAILAGPDSCRLKNRGGHEKLDNLHLSRSTRNAPACALKWTHTEFCKSSSLNTI